MALEPHQRLRTHWYDRPAWSTDGARYLTWFVLPDDAAPLAGSPGLVDATAPARAALAGVEGLAALADGDLHATVQGVGPAGEVDAAARARLVAAATAALSTVRGPVLAWEGPSVHEEGVLVEGRPHEGVAQVRTALRAAARATGLEPPGADDEPVWPHVSLAYACSDVPAARAHGALAPSATAWPAPRTRLAAASLVELRREHRRYAFDVVARVALG